MGRRQVSVHVQSRGAPVLNKPESQQRQQPHHASSSGGCPATLLEEQRSSRDNYGQRAAIL